MHLDMLKLSVEITKDPTRRKDFLVRGKKLKWITKVGPYGIEERKCDLKCFYLFLTNHKWCYWEKGQLIGYWWKISCLLGQCYMMNKCTWQLVSNPVTLRTSLGSLNSTHSTNNNLTIHCQLLKYISLKF